MAMVLLYGTSLFTIAALGYKLTTQNSVAFKRKRDSDFFDTNGQLNYSRVLNSFTSIVMVSELPLS